MGASNLHGLIQGYVYRLPMCLEYIFHVNRADAPVLYNIHTINCIIRSRDSSVSVSTGYGLDDWGVRVRVPVGSRIFSSPNRPDRLWGPPNLLFSEYRRLWSWPLTFSYCRGQENMDLYSHSPIHLYFVVLNSLSTRTTLLFTDYMI
jgi:hypothetical protein